MAVAIHKPSTTVLTHPTPQATPQPVHVCDDSNPPNAAITTTPIHAVDPLSNDAGVTLIEPRPARNQPLQASLLPFESMPQL
jgi:hypothetical protein